MAPVAPHLLAVLPTLISNTPRRPRMPGTNSSLTYSPHTHLLERWLPQRDWAREMQQQGPHRRHQDPERLALHKAGVAVQQ